MTQKRKIRKDISHLIGTKVSRLTVLEDLGTVDKLRKIRCICECGVEKIFNYQNVISGKSKSCGCLIYEATKKHGLSNHQLYSVWEGMIQRCCNENAPKYENYGGRGVKICDEWRDDFKVFYEWAINNGYKQGLTLDKDILAEGKLGMLYSPEYCCFVTQKENTQKRTNSHLIEIDGEKKCISQWADFFNIKYHIFSGRWKKGWDLHKIISQPVKTYAKNANY